MPINLVHKMVKTSSLILLRAQLSIFAFKNTFLQGHRELETTYYVARDISVIIPETLYKIAIVSHTLSFL